jgi:hypothetical protein
VLYLDETNVCVEVPEIGRIAGDHGLIASAGIEHHPYVDQVVCASLAIQDAGSLGVRLVKGRDGDVGQTQRSRKAELARAGPPCLSRGTGRDVDGQPGGVRLRRVRGGMSSRPCRRAHPGNQCAGWRIGG